MRMRQDRALGRRGRVQERPKRRRKKPFGPDLQKRTEKLAHSDFRRGRSLRDRRREFLATRTRANRGRTHAEARREHIALSFDGQFYVSGKSPKRGRVTTVCKPGEAPTMKGIALTTHPTV